MTDRRRLLAAAPAWALGTSLGARADAAAPAAAAPGALPHVQAGRLERWADFPSRHVSARHVDLWWPEGADDGRPLDLLVVHDGQMQFDPATTWNGQAWRLDVALTALRRAGRGRDVLVAAVWNDPVRRHGDYCPDPVFRRLSAPAAEAVLPLLAGGPRGDATVRFLCEELVPALHARTPVRRGPAHTFVMGSSMGGLLSLHAFCERPDVFGGAACLSTHWAGLFVRNAGFPLAALGWLDERLPRADGTRRLYMDRGTETLDALYGPAQAMVDELAWERGWRAPHFTSRVFEGAAHTEAAWAARVGLPLDFLLSPPA